MDVILVVIAMLGVWLITLLLLKLHADVTKHDAEEQVWINNEIGVRLYRSKATQTAMDAKTFVSMSPSAPPHILYSEEVSASPTASLSPSVSPSLSASMSPSASLSPSDEAPNDRRWERHVAEKNINNWTCRYCSSLNDKTHLECRKCGGPK